MARARWMRWRETALIAASVVATVALVLTIGCLEAEYRHGMRISAAGGLAAVSAAADPADGVPAGVADVAVECGCRCGAMPVMLAHLVFVLPYVFLSLADPFRAWDSRMGTIAAALGSSPDGVLWRVRLPMLLRPVLTAFAVGVAVSVGQYLPTLLIGGGRVATITTEAVALASGGDRRAIGVYGLMQTGAALVPFALALLIPALVWRNRRGLRHG